jgi:hypothetical protein
VADAKFGVTPITLGGEVSRSESVLAVYCKCLYERQCLKTVLHTSEIVACHLAEVSYHTVAVLVPVDYVPVGACPIILIEYFYSSTGFHDLENEDHDGDGNEDSRLS